MFGFFYIFHSSAYMDSLVIILVIFLVTFVILYQCIFCSNTIPEKFFLVHIPASEFSILAAVNVHASQKFSLSILGHVYDFFIPVSGIPIFQNIWRWNRF